MPRKINRPKIELLRGHVQECSINEKFSIKVIVESSKKGVSPKFYDANVINYEDGILEIYFPGIAFISDEEFQKRIRLALGICYQYSNIIDVIKYVYKDANRDTFKGVQFSFVGLPVFVDKTKTVEDIPSIIQDFLDYCESKSKEK